MSTRSTIAVHTEKGYCAIYCHFDGYPAYMFPMLQDNYNSEELALKLVSFGDASVIDKKLEPTTTSHNFDNPEAGVCIFYHRDRGEDWEHVKPYYFYSIAEMCKQQEFTYIFDKGKWTAYSGSMKINVENID